VVDLVAGDAAGAQIDSGNGSRTIGAAVTDAGGADRPGAITGKDTSDASANDAPLLHQPADTGG
jgi:hypothetical protein